MTTWSKLSPSVVPVIRERRMAGETLQAIADTYGVSRERIRQLSGDITRRLVNGGPCSVEGCARGCFARGLCGTHYSRLRLTGTTDDPPRHHCPDCAVVFPLRMTHCPGCGVSKYSVYPPSRIGPVAQGRALTRLCQAHPRAYSRLYQAGGQSHARITLSHRYPSEYRRYYREARSELERALA